MWLLLVISALASTAFLSENSDNFTSVIKTLSDVFDKQDNLLTEINSSLSCQNRECQNANSQLENIDESLRTINNTVAASNYVNFVLISISIGIAGIAAISAWGTAYFSRKQLQQAEKDLKMRFSPRVIIDGPRPSQVALKDGGVLDYDTFSKSTNPLWDTVDQIIFRFYFRNIGGDVAIKMSNIKIVKEEPFDSSEFEDKPDFPMGLILTPNQEFSLPFAVDLKRFDVLEQKNLFAGLSIAYEDLSGNKKYTGVIYGIRRGSNYVIHSWLSTDT
ncbi:MAG: hypothetical protein WBE60_07305 [Nitrosotalea sp.]